MGQRFALGFALGKKVSQVREVALVPVPRKFLRNCIQITRKSLESNSHETSEVFVSRW